MAGEERSWQKNGGGRNKLLREEETCKTDNSAPLYTMSAILYIENPKTHPRALGIRPSVDECNRDDRWNETYKTRDGGRENVGFGWLSRREKDPTANRRSTRSHTPGCPASSHPCHFSRDPTSLKLTSTESGLKRRETIFTAESRGPEKP